MSATLTAAVVEGLDVVALQVVRVHPRAGGDRARRGADRYAAPHDPRARVDRPRRDLVPQLDVLLRGHDAVVDHHGLAGAQGARHGQHVVPVVEPEQPPTFGHSDDLLSMSTTALTSSAPSAARPGRSVLTLSSVGR